MSTRGKELRSLSDRKQSVSYMGHDMEYIPGFLLERNSREVRSLNLSHNRLKSLDGLGSFANLEELTLDNNRIGDEITFPRIPSLLSLSLNNNLLVNLPRLLAKVVRSFPKVVYLSLLGNAACPNELSSPDKTIEDYRQYRLQVAAHLPSLRFLDWKEISRAERARGTSPYTPLPRSGETPMGEGAVAGTIRYKYVGKKSEGNRFIKNSDL